MKRVLAIALFAGLAVVAAANAAPLTKQNGRSPASTGFTSICAVSGFVGYGFCNGDPTTFAGVKGRINAVQPKAGVYNLDFTFSNLAPGLSYRLYGNRSGLTPIPGVVIGFFPIATTIASSDGTAEFSYQTTSPTELGFDLNVASSPLDPGDVTVVTSWWSKQWLERNADTTLYALSG
jgi:hypothetical protein